MSYFKLHLQNESGVRIAEYLPDSSTLIWSDTKEEVIPRESGQPKNWNKITPTSPDKPAGKIKALKKIKIQMGFGCNYSCTYCSQNNLRTPLGDSAKVAVGKIPTFFSNMPKWFDGGENGRGLGVKLEFWGGETLLYWPAVVALTEQLRAKYPDLALALFTNGSLVKKEIVDFALKNRIHFNVSHDGPTFNEDRAKDPFEIPAQAENLHYLFKILSPEKLISFNATVSPKNNSLLKIRKYISDKLGVEPTQIVVTYALATPYDIPGLSYIAQKEKRQELINGLFKEMLSYYPFDMSLGMSDIFIHDFFESLRFGRTGEFVGQKCSMDLPSSLALDLEGNILTCQNVTAKGGHKIGHIDSFKDTKLATAYHWSQRRECVKCPVVQICKGSCMYLTDNLWQASCDQHFTWGLAYLALALHLLTDRLLIKIEGEAIRANTEEHSIDILFA